jgi:D-galactarolactone cycloisomerase
MKIARVETFPLYLGPEESAAYIDADSELARGYRVKPPWRSIYSTGTETLLVKITTDEGVIGWGEALAPVAPQVAARIVESLLTPFLIGEDPLAGAVIQHRMSESMRERGHLTGHQADAAAAVDIALWDLRGRILGLPVAQLLGGPFVSEVPAYVSGVNGTDDAEIGSKAAALADAGARRFKLHLGRGVKADIATVDAVLDAVPGALVAVDAHWSYDLGAARLLGRELDDRGAWFFEAPLAPEDVAGHTDLAVAVATPIAVGEAMRNRFEFDAWLMARALQVAQPDVGRTGITEAIAISTVADARHARVAPHHSAALGVAMAAGLHVAAAIPNLLSFEHQPALLATANRILTEPIESLGGALRLPSLPGLGVRVDEDAVRSFVATD